MKGMVYFALPISISAAMIVVSCHTKAIRRLEENSLKELELISKNAESINENMAYIHGNANMIRYFHGETSTNAISTLEAVAETQEASEVR